MTPVGTFRVDAEQVVFLDDIELFRHGAPHSGAWTSLAKKRLNAKNPNDPKIAIEAKALVDAYRSFLAAHPAEELSGKYPIAWFQESPVRNGMRLSYLPWESPEYHRALRDMRTFTECVIPVNYGLSEDQRAENERMQAVRDENGNVIRVAAGAGVLGNIDVGPMIGANVVPEELRKLVVKEGFVPETFMTMKRWNTVPPEIFPVLIAMGVHKAKSWGMLLSQVSPDMLRVMVLHRDQFSAWPDFEPERDALREKVLALMLKIQKDPEGANTFNDYYNAGGTTRGLIENSIDTVRKLRGATELLDAETKKAPGGKVVPSNYCPPAIELPQGVEWANVNTFPTLSKMYGNCISNSNHYSSKIADGYAHVVYRTHRGEDERGLKGGMCCYISYATEDSNHRERHGILQNGVRGDAIYNVRANTWYIQEVSGYQNSAIPKAYFDELIMIIQKMNENPNAYIKLFREKAKASNTSEKPTCTPAALKIPMPATDLWGDGVSFAVLYSLERNRKAKISASAAPVVRRMRSAAI